VLDEPGEEGIARDRLDAHQLVVYTGEESGSPHS
jgi:hypothetical protein